MNPNYDTLGMTDRSYKRYAVKVAKELGYGDEVIAKIRKAKDDYEIERALRTARERLMQV